MMVYQKLVRAECLRQPYLPLFVQEGCVHQCYVVAIVLGILVQAECVRQRNVVARILFGAYGTGWIFRPNFH